MPRTAGNHDPLRALGGALDGLRVLEIGENVAAPYCAKLLADLGADVIKLETPGIGDPSRARGPFADDVPHPERSALFLYLNTSKRSVTLNLETPEGQQIASELASRADVLVEDRPPGFLEGLGLGYAELAQRNPRLVVTSITPFGQTGPNRMHKSHHLNLYHSAGHFAPFGAAPADAEGAAPVAGAWLGEYDAGLTAALGILAAVFGREVTGRGQHIDISKQEAMMGLERVTIGRFANEPDPFGGPRPGGLMRAKDGWIILTILEQHQWEGLVRAMGSPEWASADWCRDAEQRMANQQRLRQRLEAWAAGLTRDEIYHLAQGEGTPAGAVRDVAEVKAWRQIQARGFFRELDHPEVGRQSYPTAPYQFSETPWLGRAAPLLGEHGAEVLGGLLGRSDAELALLAEKGVI
jgi:crotonobetainyl-CoA:carnitine CoA-transferase CaiB-like acyl-CoA transferase